jgi:hypothetical protein
MKIRKVDMGNRDTPEIHHRKDRPDTLIYRRFGLGTKT